MTSKKLHKINELLKDNKIWFKMKIRPHLLIELLTSKQILVLLRKHRGLYNIIKNL